MYKKDRVVFSANLSEISFHDEIEISKRRESYLLSEKYSSSSNIERAIEANNSGRLIISDNGNFTRMSRVAGLFKTECQALLNEAKALKKEGAPFPNSIQERRTELIRKIELAADEESASEVELREILQAQFLIAPQYLIGFEDLTIPSLILAGLMDDVFNPQYHEIHHFQNKTRSLFEAQLDGKYGFKKELAEAKLLYVVHAYDYHSAYQVGKMLSDSSLEYFAISYGGPMKSNRWRTHINWNNETVDLGANYPEKFILAQSISKGFIDGIQRKVHLHVLGCGSPIMILLTGSLLPHLYSLTFDSSAPLQDAFDGYVYNRNLAFTKIKIEKLVAYQLQKEESYYTRDSFYHEYASEHPNDWIGLGKAMEIDGTDTLQSAYKKVLSQPDRIREYLPFFSLITSGEEDFFEPIRVYRSGFNYWMLRNICNNLRNKVDHLQEFYAWTDKEIARYVAHSNSRWGESVERAYSMSRKINSA